MVVRVCVRRSQLLLLMSYPPSQDEWGKEKLAKRITFGGVTFVIVPVRTNDTTY